MAGKLRRMFAGRSFRVWRPTTDTGMARPWPGNLPRPVRRALMRSVPLGQRWKPDMPPRICRQLAACVQLRDLVEPDLAAVQLLLDRVKVPRPWLLRQLRRGGYAAVAG